MTNNIFHINLHSDFIEEFRALGASSAIRGTTAGFASVYCVPEEKVSSWVLAAVAFCPSTEFIESNFFPAEDGGWEMTFAGAVVFCGAANAILEAKKDEASIPLDVWGGFTVLELMDVFTKPESKIDATDAMFIRDVIPWLCDWVNIDDHKFMDVEVVPEEAA